LHVNPEIERKKKEKKKEKKKKFVGNFKSPTNNELQVVGRTMSELQPIIPREENQHGNPTIPPQDTPEPVPITEQEVGEYREQDRFLPVSFSSSFLTFMTKLKN
jgi:hypothetical protein